MKFRTIGQQRRRTNRKKHLRQAQDEHKREALVTALHPPQPLHPQIAPKHRHAAYRPR